MTKTGPVRAAGCAGQLARQHREHWPRRVRKIYTGDMTPVELAKVFAHAKGFHSNTGGWIHSPQCESVAHGWVAFAEWLIQRGWIRSGVGIAWTVAAWEMAAGRPARFIAELRGGCGCACNSGGFCGGCGHAGCGGRRR